ncbi:MAG: superoxide dismutase family protein [Thermodesulfobacteriota bacterium]
MKYRALIALMAFLLLLVWGCGGPTPEKAKATLVNAQGQKVGEAQLVETPHGVKITLKVENLPPGVHAFHIHEKGDCHCPDFMSSGGHFNPFGKKHGLKNQEGPHAGDLPNLVVGEDGKETLEVIASRVTLKPGKNSLLQPGGTSLMIHANPDDYLTDPAGNAGPRIACGTIIKQ